jgi:hypothetical protein
MRQQSVSLIVPPPLLCVHQGVTVWGDGSPDASDFVYRCDPGDVPCDVRQLADQLGRPAPSAHDHPAHAALVVAALDAGLLVVPRDPDLPSWADWLAYLAEEARVSQYAGFATRCPRCGADDTLRVVAGLFATDMPLSAEGFSPTDAHGFDTSEEVVVCGACDLALPLGFLTL